MRIRIAVTTQPPTHLVEENKKQLGKKRAVQFERDMRGKETEEETSTKKNTTEEGTLVLVG
jgi:hypothetical protein